VRLINIAIDGPAGAGKSSTARLVANLLGYVYVDTGAMYRAVTWNMLHHGLTPDQNQRLVELVNQMNISLKPSPHGQQVFVGDCDVTSFIRSSEVNRFVSQVATIPEIRERLVGIQQRMAERKGIVMDGRDIGTRVLPDAELKIFLTASARERAIRRYAELVNPTITLDELEQEIVERDRMDTERDVSPLVQAGDAILLDSTLMTRDEVVEKILYLCRSKMDGR
jgi:cytidylate kinase